jgi:hypothetical protein
MNTLIPVALALTLLSTSAAHACKRLPPTPESEAQARIYLRESAKTAVAIIAVEVLTSSALSAPTPKAGPKAGVVRITRSYKGRLKRGGTLRFVHPGHSCGTDIQKGQTGLLILQELAPVMKFGGFVPPNAVDAIIDKRGRYQK